MQESHQKARKLLHCSISRNCLRQTAQAICGNWHGALTNATQAGPTGTEIRVNWRGTEIAARRYADARRQRWCKPVLIQCDLCVF
jgi:hypothetical protein